MKFARTNHRAGACRPREKPPIHRSAGACPPREKPPVHRSAGACPPQSLRCLKQDFQDSQDFQDYLPRGGETSAEKGGTLTPFSRGAASVGD